MTTAEAIGHVAIITTSGILSMFLGLVGVVIGAGGMIIWALYTK